MGEQVGRGYRSPFASLVGCQRKQWRGTTPFAVTRQKSEGSEEGEKMSVT